MCGDKTVKGLAGYWNDPLLDHARADLRISELAGMVDVLKADNDTLVRDLERSGRYRRECAENLRKAREKNRQLWLKLSAREVGGK